MKTKKRKINKALNHILIGDILYESDKLFNLEQKGKACWISLIPKKK